MSNNEICVSGKTLELDGAAPVAGDEVEVIIKGKVTRAEDGKVYIKPETANGQPMKDAGSDEAPKEPDEEQLRDMAAAADNEPENQASITA